MDIEYRIIKKYYKYILSPISDITRETALQNKSLYWTKTGLTRGKKQKKMKGKRKQQASSVEYITRTAEACFG